jgi:hypothetical protein
MVVGTVRIAQERVRQIEAEDYGPEHDDTHKSGQLAAQAVYLATPVRAYKINPHANGVTWEEIRGRDFNNGLQRMVDWQSPDVVSRHLPYHYLSSTDEGPPLGWGEDIDTIPELRARRIRELEQAGALIAAEIDRLLRVDA